MANPLSLYIHIPFCAAKCPYCDFYSLSEVGGDLVEEYCTALLRQGETLAPLAMGRSVETIFFGGGTPSQLSADSIIRILVGLGKSFAISPTAEISIEVNPADADTAWFAAIKSAGVTRVSFGGQSFNDTALAALGRRHKGADITTSVQLAQSHGLDTSIDLMFALPKQDRADMLASLAAAVELGVGHISLYGLKVEEDTPFYAQRHTLCLPSEEAEADMYLAAVDFLAAGGYAQYEVSNFARHGLECRHNLNYWQCGEYLGLGTGAYSYFGGVRFGVERDVDRYVGCDDFAISAPIYCDHEPISPAESAREEIILGLRLSRGVAVERLPTEQVEKCVAEGLGKVSEGRFSLTPQGMLVCNRVIGEMLVSQK